MLDEIASRAAEIVMARLDNAATRAWPEWLDVKMAARYLGHRCSKCLRSGESGCVEGPSEQCNRCGGTGFSPERLRKLVARHEVPFMREAPGCRVSFRRRD